MTLRRKGCEGWNVGPRRLYKGAAAAAVTLNRILNRRLLPIVAGILRATSDRSMILRLDQPLSAPPR